MSEWISVEDRLPEKNVRVWAHYEASENHSGLTWWRSGQWFAAWWGDRWSNRIELQAMAELCCDSLKITHWMPLPAPPEDES